MVEIVVRFVDCHVFRRRDSKVEWLVVKRAPHTVVPNTWQHVQGAIEGDETAWQAALRELHEETGLVPINFYTASFANRFYLPREDQLAFNPVFCAEVAADAQVVLNDEHTNFDWVTAQEARSRFPWPGQKDALDCCIAQFIDGTPRPESVLPIVGN